MSMHPLFFYSCKLQVFINQNFKFRKFNLQVLIYKCRKYVSYLPPC